MSERIRRIKALIAHRRAFKAVAVDRSMVRGNIPLKLRFHTHDLDKLLLLMFIPIPVKWIRKIHKKIARHHNRKSYLSMIEFCVDISCARITKTKSDATAKEWVDYIYKRDEIGQEEYETLRDIISHWKMDDHKVTKSDVL